MVPVTNAFRSLENIRHSSDKYDIVIQHNNAEEISLILPFNTDCRCQEFCYIGDICVSFSFDMF